LVVKLGGIDSRNLRRPLMKRSGLTACRWFVVLLIGAIGAATTDAAPALFTLRRTIDDPHPEEERDFGWSLDTFNDDLLVGSYGGSVYVIDPQTGIESLRLESPEPFGSFGRAVTQFGDTIVVGANELDRGPHVRVGSAYVFDGASGAHLRTLRNPNPAHFGWFGISMESAADRLFVSSESASANSRGRVYVYGPDSTTPIGSLQNPQAGTANSWGFGFALKENNGKLFVAAPGAFTGGQETGAIHRYDAATLARELTIANPNPQFESQFGHSLATSGSLLLAGAPGLTVGGASQAGGAFLFDAESGALRQTFLNPEPQNNASFGDSVAIVSNYAVIGAPYYSPNPGRYPGYVGAAYVFELSSGAFVKRIDNPSPEQNDWFPLGDGTTLASIRGELAIGHGFGQQVHLFTVPEPTGSGQVLVGSIAVIVCARPSMCRVFLPRAFDC